MQYSLFHKDNEALRFDLNESYIQIIDNNHLPYALKDYILTTGEKDFKGSLHDITVLRDYLASRTLNLSRENAKTILNVAALPQSLNTEQKLKIVMTCNGLTMQDNFWLRKEGRTETFNDVCLRHRKLSEASYDIAILGHHISATADELIPDLTTEGMFPKYWHRTPDGTIELWKTDRLDGKINSKCEIEASQILDNINYPHVKYREEHKGDKIFSVCRCMSDDHHSFVPMQDIMDWHQHTGMDFPSKIQKLFDRYFPDMCIIDYVLANTDRHSGNWGVITDDNNNIIDFAPMFDMNQALVADMLNTDISKQIYEPTGITFKETLKIWAPYSTIDWTNIPNLPEKVKSRAGQVKECQKAKNISTISLITSANRQIADNKFQIADAKGGLDGSVKDQHDEMVADDINKNSTSK